MLEPMKLSSLGFSAALLVLHPVVGAAQSAPSPAAPPSAPAATSADLDHPQATPSAAPPPPAYPPGAYPQGAYPQGAYPQGAYPPGAYPPPAYPPGAYGAYPPAYPPSAYPPDAYPQGAYPYPPMGPPRMKRHSPALMGGGIFLTAFGGLSLIGAATTFGLDSSGGGDFSGFASLLIGLPLLVHGLGCIAGGIPMIVVGNKQIPEGSASLVPSLVPSRGGAAMQWLF